MANISFSREPAVWIAVIKAGLYAGAHFGLQVTPDQLLGIIAFCETVGATIQRNVSFAPVSKDGAKLEEVKYVGSAPEAVK
jgi:hypothetical protein